MKSKMKLLEFCCSLAVLFTFVSPTIAVPYFEKRQATSPGVTPDQIDLTLFANLEPSKDLKWVTCYQVYCCARLEVPLNYDEPHGKKIQLALVKLPAKPGARYKGALYLQIGLGVPATNLVLEFGPSFQIPTLEGYDIIGWDVRGAGQSTPLLTCFPDQAARLAYLGAAPKILGDPSYRTLEEGIRANLEYAKTFGEACRERSGEFLPYYDTPNSARDLHTIMKATGAKTITAFWGYQYATLLGETFAALFPHAFNHLILDGVVDGELQYGFGDVLPSSIQDTEKAFRVFFDSCFKAGPGPTGCAFYADSPEKIRERYNKVEKKLIDSPIPVPGLGTFDYSAQHRLISGAVTDPNNLFPFLAAILAEAESGTAGDAIKGILSFPLPPLPITGIDGPFEYSSAIQCLDSDPYQLKETKDFKKYLKSMLETSPCCGSTIAQLKLVCAGWKVPAACNFDGHDAFNKRTKGQVLLVGNAADPFTPLASAKKVSTQLKNSRVLTLNAVGFTSIIFNSECRLQTVAKFLNQDELPEKEAVCQQDNTPFGIPLGNLLATEKGKD